MSFRELRYFISEACKSIWYNKIMTLAALITVTGCLLLFGVFLLFSINVNYIADQVISQCEIQAYINKDIDYSGLEAIQGQIQAIEGVATVNIETQEQAFKNCVKMLGDRADGLNSGFLRPSCIVTLKDLRAASSIAEQIKGIQFVESVSNRQDILNNILNTTNIIKGATLAAMLLLSVIAIFIISNTIKLAVHAREKEIHIMKYVGATDWFIRWPFIIEGIIIGFIGSAISIIIVSVAYGSTLAALSGFNIFEFKALSDIIFILIALLVLMGCIMGAVGSVISVRRHLKV